MLAAALVCLGLLQPLSMDGSSFKRTNDDVLSSTSKRQRRFNTTSTLNFDHLTSEMEPGAEYREQRELFKRLIHEQGTATYESEATCEAICPDPGWQSLSDTGVAVEGRLVHLVSW